MKRRTIRRAARSICALGFFLVLCTAGASDMNTITIGRAFWQSVAGLGMFVIGGTVGGLIEW